MPATELKGIVDEDSDDDHPHQQQVVFKWRDCSTWDWNNHLSHRTDRIVRIKDRYLGCMYWVMITAILMYSLIYVFHIEGRHTQQATGVGTVITKFGGKVYSGDLVFDGPDLRFPVIEPSGAFLMTRRIVVRGQQRGNCVDWDSPRKCPCADGDRCVDGYCEVKGWCPSIGDFNTDRPPAGAQVQQMTGLGDTILHITAAISFPGIGNRLYVMGDSPGATNIFKTIKLGKLLEMAQPPVKVDDILERGGLISVSFFWNCEVVAECEPTVVIKQLDSGQGFQQKRAWTKRTGKNETRDAMYMFGLRILVDSSGIGRRVSVPLIVLQIGSCIALLRLAQVFADFIMLKLYKFEIDFGSGYKIGNKDKGDAYERCKVKPTEDYSDLQDRLNLIKEKETQSGKDSGPQLLEGRSGTHVPLGLGAGGRGGMASTILRGRNTSAS